MEYTKDICSFLKRIESKLDGEEREESKMWMGLMTTQSEIKEATDRMRTERRVITVNEFDFSFPVISKDGPVNDIRTKVGCVYEQMLAWDEELESQSRAYCRKVVDLAPTMNTGSEEGERRAHEKMDEMTARYNAMKLVKRVLFRELAAEKKELGW